MEAALTTTTAGGPEPWHVTLLRLALSFCGCDRPPACQITGAAPLKCYYDMNDALVMRQLEFRRMRKTARDASTTSLSSLGTVSEYEEELHMPHHTAAMSDIMNQLGLHKSDSPPPGKVPRVPSR